MFYLKCISCGEVFDLIEGGPQAARDHQLGLDHDPEEISDDSDLFDGYAVATEEEAF